MKIENKTNIGQIILTVGYLKTSVCKQLLIQFFFFINQFRSKILDKSCKIG